MADEETSIDRRVTYDFETDRLYLMYMSGMKANQESRAKYIVSKAYIYAIIIFFFFLVGMGSVAVILIQDKKLRLEAVHWTFLLLVGLSFMLIRYTKGLDGPLSIIKSGFFTYEDEEIDDRYFKLKQYRVRRVRLVSNFFLGLAISSGVFLSFIKQVNKSSKNKDHGKSINTGLPIPIYLPFDTTTLSGFILGYLIDVVAFFYLVVITSATQQIFLSIMEQLIAQYEILNMSVSNVEDRALADFLKGRNHTAPKGLPYDETQFQLCIFRCLRSNIRHHQALLKFRTAVKSFNESIFLLLVLSSIIIFAAIMFVILELQEMSEATILLWLLSTEIVYVFVVCFYGELLSQESGKLFFILWDTPWSNFNEDNKRLLHVMMSNAMNPIVMGAPGFSSNMSLETFGDIMARAYQFMSVVRNMSSSPDKN